MMDQNRGQQFVARTRIFIREEATIHVPSDFPGLRMRDGNEFFIYKLGSRWTQPPQSVGTVEWLYLVASRAIRHAPPL